MLHCERVVGRERNLMKKLLELRIRAEAVKAGIVLQIDDPIGTETIGALQKVQGFLSIADSGPGRCQIIVRNWLTYGVLFSGRHVRIFG